MVDSNCFKTEISIVIKQLRIHNRPDIVLENEDADTTYYLVDKAARRRGAKPEQREEDSKRKNQQIIQRTI